MSWSCHDDTTQMASRRIILLLASAVAVFAVSTSAAPATLLPGPITHLRVVSRSTLRPGVIFTHYRATVRGYSRAQEIYRISWAIGDTHVTLGSALLGTYHPASETVDVHPISSLGAPARPACRRERRLLRVHDPYRVPQQRHAGEAQEDLQLRLGWPGRGVSPGRRLRDRPAAGAAGQAEAPQPADRDDRRVRRPAGSQRPGRRLRHRRHRRHGARGICGVHDRLDGLSHDASRRPHLAQSQRARQARAGGRVCLCRAQFGRHHDARFRSSAASRRGRR